MKPLSAKRTQRSSLRATKNLVEELGGRLVSGSGSGLEKGDGRVLGRFRIETKRPPTGKYRLTFQDWEKIRDAAVRSNEIPVFHLVLSHTEVIVLREQDYGGLGGTALLDMYATARAGHVLFPGDGTEEHMGFVVQGTPKGSTKVKTYILRVMPKNDFIKLAEESA